MAGIVSYLPYRRALGHRKSYNSAFLTSKRGWVQGGCKSSYVNHICTCFFAEYIQLDVVVLKMSMYNYFVII